MKNQVQEKKCPPFLAVSIGALGKNGGKGHLGNIRLFWGDMLPSTASSFKEGAVTIYPNKYIERLEFIKKYTSLDEFSDTQGVWLIIKVFRGQEVQFLDWLLKHLSLENWNRKWDYWHAFRRIIQQSIKATQRLPYYGIELNPRLKPAPPKPKKERELIPGISRKWTNKEMALLNPSERLALAVTGNRIKDFQETSHLIYLLAHQLTEREEKILRAKIGLSPFDHPLTSEEIGQHFAVTRKRIHQIAIKAIRKLRLAEHGS